MRVVRRCAAACAPCGVWHRVTLRCGAAAVVPTTRRLCSSSSNASDATTCSEQTSNADDADEWRRLHAQLCDYDAQQRMPVSHDDGSSDVMRDDDEDDDDEAMANATLQREAEALLPPLWLPAASASDDTASTDEATSHNALVACADATTTTTTATTTTTSTSTATVLSSRHWFRMAGQDSYIAQQDDLHLSWPTPPAARVGNPQCLAHHHPTLPRSSSDSNATTTTTRARRCCVLVVYGANDLRVHDHYPLALASARAHALGGVPVVAVCVLDIRTFAQPSAIAGFYRQGPLRAQFLLDTVAALRDELERTLHVPLLVRCGRPEEHVPRLAVELGAVDVYLTTQYAHEARQVHDTMVDRLRRGVWVSRRREHTQLHEQQQQDEQQQTAAATSSTAPQHGRGVRVCERCYYAGSATTVLVCEHRPRDGVHPYSDSSNNNNNDNNRKNNTATTPPPLPPPPQVHSVWQTTLVHLDDLPTPVAAMKEGERWYHDDVTAATIRPTAPYDASIARLAQLPCWHELLPAARERGEMAAGASTAGTTPSHHDHDHDDDDNVIVRGRLPTLQQLGYGDVARYFAFTDVIATTRAHPAAGEAAALRHVDVWLANGGLTSMLRYARDRRTSTAMYSDKLSRVSPYLAVGALSPRRLYEQLRRYTHAQQRDGFAQQQCREAVLRLSRRDYWHWMAGLRWGGRMRCPYGPHPEASDAIADWRHDRAVIDRWCRGLTGVPFADAAMRELVGTGYVAAPGRQALVWLLARGYGQDWRIAAEWLARCSLDHDACVCDGNTAYYCELLPDDFGEPVRTTPYLAHQHDQTGIYVKKWLPQLSRVPPVYVHRPHVLTPRMQAMMGVRLGKNYPYPLKLWAGAQHTLDASELTSYVTAPHTPHDNDSNNNDNDDDDMATAAVAEHAIAGPGYGEAARHGTALLDPHEWAVDSADMRLALACGTSTRHTDNSASATAVAVHDTPSTRHHRSSSSATTVTWTDVYLPASAFDDDVDDDSSKVTVTAAPARAAAAAAARRQHRHAAH